MRNVELWADWERLYDLAEIMWKWEFNSILDDLTCDVGFGHKNVI